MDTGYQPFNQDIAKNEGYLYTTNARLSSQMANQRLTDIAVEVAAMQGKKVLDLGCGDGTYTIDLFDATHPASMHGIDAAADAIEVAQRRVGERQIVFEAASAYKLPYESNSFDVAHLRGVLHHLDDPVAALREALRVAPTLVVIEPNGYNPMLKLLEKFSRYHIEHNEKSYAPHRLNRWLGKLGATIAVRRWAGLVPFFCPDWMARTLKVVEPVTERLPVVREASCAVYVIVATRSSGK